MKFQVKERDKSKDKEFNQQNQQNQSINQLNNNILNKKQSNFKEGINNKDNLPHLYEKYKKEKIFRIQRNLSSKLKHQNLNVNEEREIILKEDVDNNELNNSRYEEFNMNQFKFKKKLNDNKENKKQTEETEEYNHSNKGKLLENPRQPNISDLLLFRNKSTKAINNNHLQLIKSRYQQKSLNSHIKNMNQYFK